MTEKVISFFGRGTYLMVLQLHLSSFLLIRHSSPFFRVTNQHGPYI
jgi:hypothetical protein